MTGHAFAGGKSVEGFDAPAGSAGWDFLAVEGGMKGVGRQYQFVKRLLGVSNTLAFKIWKLRKGLQLIAFALAAVILVVGAWAAWRFRDTELVKAVTVGAIGMLILSAALTALGTALVGKKLMRVVRLRETLIRAAVGFFAGILGWLAAWLHLRVFDPMFLREGSIDNYRRKAPLDERRAKETAKETTNAAAHGNGHAGSPNASRLEMTKAGTAVEMTTGTTVESPEKTEAAEEHSRTA
jgi:hypothetical protein